MDESRTLPESGPAAPWLSPLPPAEIRVGTAERNQVVDDLREHFAAGRLELHEFEDRVGLAYAARTAGDLGGLLFDLPSTGERRPARHTGTAPGIPTRRRPAAPIRLGFRRLIGSFYAYVSLVLILIWAWTGHPGSFWPIWVIGPWGLLELTSLFHSGQRHGRPRRC